MQINKLIHVAAFALGGALATVAQAADISGAGATFPYPLYAKWADIYKKETGIGLNYQSIGSGGGIKQIQEEDGDLWRVGHAARAEGANDFRFGSVPHRGRRRRAGHQSRRYRPWRSCSRRTDASEHFPREDHQVGRSGDQEAEPERQASIEPRSLSCIGRMARARPSSSRTI